MIINFRYAEVPKLVNLWNSTQPEMFRIDEEIFRINTIDSELFDWGASCIKIDQNDQPVAFITYKKCCPAIPSSGIDPDQVHLNSIIYDVPSHATEVFSHSYDVLKDRGVPSIQFGQDLRHFWPGCPMGIPHLDELMEMLGFAKTAECFDLERSLADYVPAETHLEILKDNPKYSVRRLEHPDLHELESFLSRTFPGRWKYDTFAKIATENRLDFIFGLFDGGTQIGFAITQQEGDLLPIAGAVWRQSLGKGWGALGPIGVDDSYRGRGLGDALLASALHGLKESGVRRCIIDWTTLDRYYGKQGFRITRRYQPMQLSLL